jgi:hypothetical protein
MKFWIPGSLGLPRHSRACPQGFGLPWHRASSTYYNAKDSPPSSHHDVPLQTTHHRERRVQRPIVEDDVPRLASQPLHPLSLADLVKSETLFRTHACQCGYSDLGSLTQTWPPAAVGRGAPVVGAFHAVTVANPTGTSHTSATKPALHRRVEPQHQSHLQQLRPLPLHPPPLAGTHH